MSDIETTNLKTEESIIDENLNSDTNSVEPAVEPVTALAAEPVVEPVVETVTASAVELIVESVVAEPEPVVVEAVETVPLEVKELGVTGVLNVATGEITEYIEYRVEEKKLEEEEVEEEEEVKEEAEEEAEEEESDDEDTKEEAEEEESDDEDTKEESEEDETDEKESDEDSEESEDEDANVDAIEHDDTVHYVQTIVIKERQQIPFPITCCATLLALLYILKIFFVLCNMTGCGCRYNSNCYCFDT